MILFMLDRKISPSLSQFPHLQMRFQPFGGISLYTPLPKIGNSSIKYFILSKVYTDEGCIK